MKDSYSFDATWEGLEKQYEAHRLAYHRIFARLGLPVIDVSSDVGMMGGKVAHEFMYLSPIGEDTLAVCPGCGKAANREVAQFRKDAFATPGGALTKVATPEAKTIAELTAFLGIDARATAKAVFYWADFDTGPGKVVMAFVRGDHDANDTQVQRLSGARALRTATPEEIAGAGAVPGYASPIGVDRARMLVVADDLVATAEGLVAGANEAGYHLLNTRCGRDYTPDAVGPVAVVYEGAPCPACGQRLELKRGIEVGNIFQLGTRYSAAMGATFTDEAGQQQPLIMGSYGIGISRLLACLAERFRDERGLMLPPQVAPYAVHLVGLGKSAEAKAHADTAYAKLTAAGIEVLFDDREASPGVKFADADLMGMPVRVTVSERSIQSGGAELRLRATGETRIVPLDALVNELPNLRESA
jgi:prolyl-tRNA synthetase